MLHDPNPHQHARQKASRYRGPERVNEIRLDELLAFCGRTMDDQYSDLLRREGEGEPVIYWAGSLELLKRPAVSIIGAREVSEAGRARANRVAREMAKAGVVVTSGLAKGVDETAHRGAIAAGGSTIAVIGTPIDKAYPAENSDLQEEIWQDHLLISQFPKGIKTWPSDFPKRNRLMAALTDASIIVEASDTSGTLHQAKECVRLNRWLFIMRSVVEDPELSWPARFLREPKVRILASPTDVFSVLGLAEREA
jgi:DNA processing protein